MTYATTTSCTTDVWSVWTDTTTATSTEAWSYWCGNSTAATTAYTTDTTWAYWVGEADSTAGHIYVRQQPIVQSARTIITPEQAAAIEENRKKAAQAEEERKQKLVVAQQRAEKTLKAHLTPEQRKAWNENRAIFVTSQSGRKFKIKEGLAHNFFEIDEHGKEIREFCAHLDTFIAKCPVADNVLAQLLALKFNEAMILKKANVWDLTQHNRPLIQRST